MAEEERVVHVCDGCGGKTEEPCTDREAIEEFGMTYEPDFADGPAWWCEQCL